MIWPNVKYSFSTYFYPSLVISNSLTYFNLFLLISTNFYLIILIFTCFYLFALIFTVSNHILLKLRLGFSCLHLGSLHPRILSENSVFIIWICQEFKLFLSWAIFEQNIFKQCVSQKFSSGFRDKSPLRGSFFEHAWAMLEPAMAC